MRRVGPLGRCTAVPRDDPRRDLHKCQANPNPKPDAGYELNVIPETPREVPLSFNSHPQHPRLRPMIQ